MQFYHANDDDEDDDDDKDDDEDEDEDDDDGDDKKVWGRPCSHTGQIPPNRSLLLQHYVEVTLWNPLCGTHLREPTLWNCWPIFLSDPGIPGPIYGSKSLSVRDAVET